MKGYPVRLAGASLEALGSGALWWPAAAALVVADLHLGKSERMARRGGALLPPYEVTDTLERLDADLDLTGARLVLCLGDSFDDLQAARLDAAATDWLLRLMAGRRWVWVAGNHDPAPVDLGGEHHAEWTHRGVSFRHIARPDAPDEVSGHYHPKVSLAGQSRRCFLFDGVKLILPAYGTYTGGLRAGDAALRTILRPGAIAVLTGRQPCAMPLPA